MSETIAVIEDVESRDIAIKRGPRAGETSTVFNVKAGGKRYGTFDADLARAANELRGKSAVLEYDVRESHKDGKSYTNYDLKSVKANAFANSTAVQPITNTNSVTVNGVDKKDLSIARAVALKAAVELTASGYFGAATADDLLGQADRYTDWLLHGPSVKPQEASSVALDEDLSPDFTDDELGMVKF